LSIGGISLKPSPHISPLIAAPHQKKIKVLTIGDHPLLPSGVGTQSRYMIESLLRSGKFQIYSFAGAMKHPNHDPFTTVEWQQNWILQPVDGFGNPLMVRQMMSEWKPDIVWFMTDPRFYEWLWDMESDIRSMAPLVYYHVWDNYPYPKYNKRFYESNDMIVTISKVTSDIVQTVAPEVKEKYIPHSLPPNLFHQITDDAVNLKEMKKEIFAGMGLKKIPTTLFFWNNRNARRKQSGSLIKWYAEFLDQEDIDRSDVTLLMHTDPEDQHGQPLAFLAEEFGLRNGEFVISPNKLETPQMALLYNIADCTINIADAEGFGLSSLESLSCGTPVISTLTGGLQEQVTDGENYFGIGIEPASKAVIGSQQVPYIYEDRVCGEDVKAAMTKIYHMTPAEREQLGAEGKKHVLKNYNFDDFSANWVNTMLEVHETFGSYETRKNYNNRWEMKKL